MTTEERREWLEERRSGVGSSDAAEILGRGWSRGDGPLKVYRSKVDPVDPRLPPGGVLRRGHDLEAVVAQKYKEVMDAELWTVPLVRHPSRTWQFASNDRTRRDGRKVELKTTTGFGDEWGEQGSADVPEVYRVQLQHQMAVTGATDMDLFALDVINWQTRFYRVDADAEFQAWLTVVEHRFWVEHVATRTPPGVGWLESLDTPGVERFFHPGSSVELPPDWLSVCLQREEAVRERDAADARVKDLNAQLRAAMGQNERATVGNYRLKLTAVPATRVEAFDRAGYVRLDVRSSR